MARASVGKTARRRRNRPGIPRTNQLKVGPTTALIGTPIASMTRGANPKTVRAQPLCAIRPLTRSRRCAAERCAARSLPAAPLEPGFASAAASAAFSAATFAAAAFSAATFASSFPSASAASFSAFSAAPFAAAAFAAASLTARPRLHQL